MNRKTALGAGVAVAAVITLVAVVVFVLLNQPPPPPPSPLFNVTGQQQLTNAVVGDYQVLSWNFTFAYNGLDSLQNVNLYLNSENAPFKTVPEVTKGWKDEYIWTPGDTSANATITISWQGGTERYEFQP